MKIGNTHDLKSFLIEQMVGVACGEIPTDVSNSVARLSQQIYNMANLELRYAEKQIRAGQALDVQPLSLSNGSKRSSVPADVPRVAGRRGAAASPSSRAS